ncbi:MAG: hypothetical protein QOG99_3338, partial [Frankiales bacterium]|nr:hypothetical protein [Frankiales bacterium]
CLDGRDLAWPQSPVDIESSYLTAIHRNNYAVLMGSRWTVDASGDRVAGTGAIAVIVNRGRGLQNCPAAGYLTPRGHTFAVPDGFGPVHAVSAHGDEVLIADRRGHRATFNIVTGHYR